MNIPPDSRQAITERIVEKSKALAMVRLRELETEGRRLRVEARDIQMRLALYCGKVSAALDELRRSQEETDILPKASLNDASRSRIERDRNLGTPSQT